MEYILNFFDSFWVEAVFRLVLGFMLAGFIGLERSSWSKPAGFRTHALVGLSAVLVMLCGEYLAKNYNMDPSRIPAQLLSGIGFIGAGTILRDGFNVKGLTTAAGLLAVTCVGLSIGAGFYLGGIVTTLIVYIILSRSYRVSDKLDHFGILDLQISIDKEPEETLTQVEKVLSYYNIEIKQMKKVGEDDESNEPTLFNIVSQYNRKSTNKNELLKKLSLIKNVRGISEAET
ncbi:MAG: MgtC/SapB family protein [Clostridia bacterium]|nr:MgtC/SapB family protein [Clostridia bacterium]